MGNDFNETITPSNDILDIIRCHLLKSILDQTKRLYYRQYVVIDWNQYSVERQDTRESKSSSAGINTPSNDTIIPEKECRHLLESILHQTTRLYQRKNVVVCWKQYYIKRHDYTRERMSSSTGINTPSNDKIILVHVLQLKCLYF